MVMSGQATSKPIRVLIVDDHAVMRAGIATLLKREADMVAVGEASDGAEAVVRFGELAPDVTLMDMQMRGMGGVEAIETIRRLSPDARILVLTTYPDDAKVLRALRAGAAGYLLKNGIRKELLDAIRLVHSGRRAISPDIAYELAVHAVDEPLTDRELTVLRLVADGQSNKQIASQLGLSAETLETHLKNIFAKLDVNDRTEAVTVAARRGFIELL
jgi:DNA-binding NarL/FixJ family response regulator